MKLMILSIILLTIFTNISYCKRPYILNLSTQDPINEIEMDYEQKQHDNIFDIKIDDEGILEGNKLYLIMESSSRDLYISIYKDDDVQQNKNVIMDLTTMSGNLVMVMSDTFFKGHLKFFQESGSLRFQVKCHEKQCPFKYKIKIQIQEQGELTAGQIYTARVDQSLKNIQFLMSYKGHDYPDLHKLRFQLQTIKKHSKFSLSAKLIDNNGSRYVLNELYKNTVGGLIDKSNFSICTSENCDYTLQIDLQGVKQLNIESFLGEKIEELKYDHYGPYYEKTYQKNQEINYILKYNKEVEGLDISVSLIPVTSHTQLYINSLSKPNDYTTYDWQETSPLAKRITIKNEELKLMKAEKEDLYLTVVTQKPGEYLIKVDAHEPGIRGRLHEGIIEDGFVLADEVVNYIYMFEIFKSQDIKFSIKMNVSSGDADLYMKQCTSIVDCNIDTQSNDKDIYNVTNNHSNKQIDHEFKCNHDSQYQATICNFAIAVKGKENNGTHYNLVLHEQQNHRLIMPGHNIRLDLNSEQIQYLKFSYPSKTNYDAQLFLEVDAIWGNFTIYISKTNEYPNQDNNDYTKSFYSSQTGLYNSLKQIELSSNIIKDARIEGTYYISINSITSCAVNIKFYESNSDSLNLHSLYAGEQQRGSLKNSQDIIYYSIRASLEQNQASSITINLTPLKGKYIIFTSRKGKVPTKEDYDLISKNNTLELSYDDYQNQEEHIIGIQLLEQDTPVDSQFQFYISFNYSNKPLKLKPGIISNYIIQKQNVFLIEITVGMIEFIILKGNNDGYNVSICASFIGNDIDLPTDQNCIKKIESKNMAIFFSESEIEENCKKFKSFGNCYIMLNVTGDLDQAFTLGYSFNDHPFQIQKEQMIYGPNIQKGDYKLNFILHLEKQKDGGLYFNSKGLNLNIYTKLIKGDDQENSILLPFPTSADHDDKNRVQRGHSTTIQYTSEDVAQHGDHPELLISIRPSIAVDKLPIYDGKNYFIMQSAQESRQILRTQVHHELLNEEEYYYYHFYNNGQNSVLTIQVSSEQPTLLEVMISRNKESRPPINDTYLVKQTGFGQVTLNVDDNILAEKTFKNVNLLKGWYTIAVKTSETNFVNIYWNNKQEFDYIELTPGTPTNITLTEKTIYFSFFAQDIEPSQSTKDKGIIKIYFRSDSRANVFILQSINNEIQAPDESNYTWQTQLPKKGGINVLEILPTDKNYCLECTYIGSFESVSTGQVTLLVDIEHDNIPIFLTPGFTFPELLNVNKQKIFRLYNSDTDALNLQFSILSGQIQVYVSNDLKKLEQSKQNFVIDELRDRYKYFKIRPSDFNVTSSSDYFILIKNNGRERASFNLQLVKNNLKTPIEPGITKSVLLGNQESVEYFFKTINSKEFQIVIEVTNVYSDNQNVQLTKKNLEIYSLKDQNKKYKLQYEIIGRSDRKIVVQGNVQANKKQDLIIELYNDTQTKIQYNVELQIEGYRLVNLDEYNIEYMNQNRYKIFEVYGKKGEFLFVDLRMCYGDDVKVSFYQSDYNKISKKDFSDYKTIKDSHSIVHYLTLEHERLFIKVQIPRNSTKKKAVFDLNIFNQRHLDDNPYTAINHTNDGIVSFDTVNMQVTVDPVLISSRYSEEYRHRLTYTVYLSQDIDMMRFAKNCDQYFLKDVHNENDVKVFKHIYDYQSISEVNTPKDFLVRINVNGLQRKKKYYGIVILKVELFSDDKSQVKPVKSGRAYYDEFIVQTQHWNFSFYGFVGIVMIGGILYCIFLIINQYVFGNIRNYKSITKLSDLVNLENETYDFNAGKVLESEFFVNKKQEEEDNDEDEQTNPHEFELSTNQL